MFLWKNHHRAVDDAACTAEIFVKFVKMLAERDIVDVDELNKQGAVSANTIKKLPTYHGIIFARNETGRINLYKLVSQSHLKYYHRRPRVPKSVLQKYRDGLLVGSACGGRGSCIRRFLQKCTGYGDCETGEFL